MDIKYEGGNVIIRSDCFCLADTLDCGQAFRFERGEDGLWRGVVHGRGLVMGQQGDVVTLYGLPRELFERYYYDYFTLSFDYAALQKTLRQDARLREAIGFCGGIRILRQDKWETLCSFIFSQNCNIPRIKGMIARLCECFGERVQGGFAFPSAERIAALTTEDLAPVRAGFRAKYIIDAAVKVAGGEVRLELLDTLPLEEAAAELMKIRGVGEKVAACTLLFSAFRVDAFPIDVWVRRIMASLYPNGLPEYARPCCGIAQQYLFHYARCNPAALPPTAE